MSRPLDIVSSKSNAGHFTSGSPFSFDIVDFDLSSSLFPPLLWSDSTSASVPVDSHYVSDLHYYDLDDDSAIIEPYSPPSSTISCGSLDSSTKYLYALDLRLHETKQDHSAYFASPTSVSPLLAHMDAGSMASTTNSLAFLWEFHPMDGSLITLRVANSTPHHPTGIGFLRIPILGPSGFASVWTFYTPSLPATIISPSSIATDLGCVGYSSFANLNGVHCSLTLHSASVSPDVVFPLQLRHGLLFTFPLQCPISLPSPSEASGPVSPPVPSPSLSDTSDLHCFHLTKHQLSHLWHQQLGHLNRHSVASMHRFAVGILLLSLPDDLDACPVCLVSKLHHVPRGTDDTRHATQCYQGLSVDFGFFVQRSSDST